MASPAPPPVCDPSPLPGPLPGARPRLSGSGIMAAAELYALDSYQSDDEEWFDVLGILDPLAASATNLPGQNWDGFHFNTTPELCQKPCFYDVSSWNL